MAEQVTSNEAFRYTVTITGKDTAGSSKSEYSQASPAGLDHVIVEDHVDMIGMSQLQFNLNQCGWDQFKIGNEVEVSVGGSDRKMFAGVISGVRMSLQSGREVVTVMAMDPLCKMASSRVTRTWTDKTDSAIVEDVLGGDKGNVEATDETHAYVLQRNESNLEFLKRLAARSGRLLMANEGKVDFIVPNMGGSPVDIAADAIESLDFGYSSAEVPKSVTCYGWDYVTNEKVEGTAGEVEEPVGDGSDAVTETGKIWEENSFISDVLVSSQDGAKAMAEAELARAARNFLRGRAVIEGNGELFAGSTVKFSGMRPGFNVTAYVVSTRHVMELSRGFTTELNFCSNTMPE